MTVAPTGGLTGPSGQPYNTEKGLIDGVRRRTGPSATICVSENEYGYSYVLYKLNMGIQHATK